MIVTLPVGQMAANCYIKDDIIIDPGDDAEFIMSKVTRPKLIIATHGHFDHIMAAFAIQVAFHIPFAMHKDDEFLLATMQKSASHFLHVKDVDPPPKVNWYLRHGEKIGDFTVVHTPGHTPGSICLQIKEDIFVGDTMFANGGIGRTDFSYSDRGALDSSLHRIFSLPGKLVVRPGHGEPTTVQKEKEYHTISI